MPSKLVRDRIPQIITAAGLTPMIRVAADHELPGLLRTKLVEEAAEVADALTPEATLDELADVLEVVHALAGRHGISLIELERTRAAKAAVRGGFTHGLVWTGNQPTAAGTAPGHLLTHGADRHVSTTPVWEHRPDPPS
jgi:predicted house-cleaning noncanonical NTP pyrophosphatase (MazG superfamily)